MQNILLLFMLLCSNPIYSFVIEQIVPYENNVFLQVDNDWIVTEGIEVTSQGTLVLVCGNWITVEEAIEMPECRRGTWECSKCHFINYEGVKACGVCGKPRNA